MVRQTAGNPILIGHHSEGRHRRWLERSGNKMRKSCKLSKISAYYHDKAGLYKYRIEEIKNRAQAENEKIRYKDLLLKMKREAKKTLKLKRLLKTHTFAHKVWYTAVKDRKSITIELAENCSLEIYQWELGMIKNQVFYENVSFDDIINHIDKYFKEYVE